MVINYDGISKICPATNLIKNLSENQLLSEKKRINVALSGYIIA